MSKRKKLMLGAALSFASVGIGGITANASTISDFAQIATPVANRYGLYPSVMIAQALLESNSGQSVLSRDYHNYFGVKWTQGPSVDLMTTEYIDGNAVTMSQPFQVYSSQAASFEAQAELLANYYPGTLRHNTSSYQDALAALQGVYATDPNYANLLTTIIESYDLTAFDGGSYSRFSASSPASGQYSVQPGDSLWSIAEAYGMTAADLASLNNLGADSILQVGQNLMISETTTAFSGGASQSSAGTYRVQSGDNLWLIAQANGSSVAELAALNGLSTDSTLQVGQILQLTTESPVNESGSYVVQSGDTLSAIANNFGVSVEDLVASNGLSDANTLAVGQTLSI